VSFRFVAWFMGLEDASIQTGRYEFPPSTNNFKLVRYILKGRQTPIKLTFNNVRTFEELSGELGRQLLLDSTELLQYFLSEQTLQEIGLNKNQVLSLFIPNTYDLYWTISVKDLKEKMIAEHDKFWKKEGRIAKADSLTLSKAEIYTLASIVEKETNFLAERRRLAGVYLNRLSSGMKLQADPTVVFALGQFDLKRVLFEHLRYDNPYNTYMYEGLPPGPICMPSIHAIDAVLNAESHDYLFFCAKIGYAGEHVFTKTLKEHATVANAYREWLNKEGIK